MVNSVNDAFRALADGLRLSLADQGFGMRLYTLQVVKTVWSGANIGDGTPTTTTITLSPNPKVLSSDGGRVLDVGPITAPYTTNGGGGYSFDQLRPLMDGVTEFFYSVTGPFNGAAALARQYELQDIKEDPPLHYMLKLVITEVGSPTI